MTLFKKLKQGLDEAIEFQKGDASVAKRINNGEKIKFKPVPVLKPSEIKKLRLSLGLSQKEFSDALGVSPETIAKWEQGGNKPQSVAVRLMTILSMHRNIMHDIMKD